MEPVMTIEDIMKILPHRYPFLLVDREKWNRLFSRNKKCNYE